MVLLVILSVPLLAIPPPAPPKKQLLPLIVLSTMFRAPAALIPPPPAGAELPRIVLPRMLIVPPLLYMPPAIVEAKLSPTTQFKIFKVPSPVKEIAPPCVYRPFNRLSPDRVTASGLRTAV